MATLFRLSREKCEFAFAQFILERKSGSLLTPVDVPILVRRGKITDQGQFELENAGEIPLPSIVVSCPRVTTHIMGYPICELHLLSLNSVDEDDCSVLIPARFGILADLFPDIDIDDVKYGAVLTAMNAPTPGPDVRKVRDFNVFGYAPVEDMGEETNTTWIDHIVLEVHCVPTDDVDGDGDA